ncbi:hypothetical protein BRARA_J00797 [Brassica rapa]|uniref:F-box domain-containing protein n=1 Tax=Brassica campestris TaxID=3711 RepID=M4CFX3_BRACM|nr:F-box protein At5g52880 [Brassica rapa]RID40776.1 hypothetical protein BRARA_J00797 [Brassica rapa]
MKPGIDDQSKPQTMIQEKYTKRYQNLKVAEALSNNHLYPFACNELSSIIDLGYSQLPKDLKAFIFRDCLSAFRLLPEMNTSAAVSAANLLVKSVESAFPKQKKNLAIVEFKQAKVALKRRTKSHDEHIDLPSLPQDILVHIFSFLDLYSLLSSSQVSRSWNQATSEGSLWRSLFDLHFTHKVLIHIYPGIDWREAFKNEYILYKSSKMLRSGRGYCSYCDSVVWHDNLRCPKKQCRLKSGKKPLDLMLTHQVVNYLLGTTSSSDESDSEDEAVRGLWAYPTLQ